MADKPSLVDAAYDVLSKAYAANGSKSTPMAFGELLLGVGQEAGITDENQLLTLASKFYTALTLDGRFVIKENNTWVLREHEKFENVHIDMNDVYSEDEDDDDDGKTDDDKSDKEDIKDDGDDSGEEGDKESDSDDDDDNN